MIIVKANIIKIKAIMAMILKTLFPSLDFRNSLVNLLTHPEIFICESGANTLLEEMILLLYTATADSGSMNKNSENVTG